MGTTTILTIIAGVLLLFILTTGVRVRIKGKPYPKPCLLIHKLFSGGILILLVIIVIQHIKEIEFNTTGWILTILAALFFFIALGSGSALIKEETKTGIKFIHRISSVLALIMIPVIWIICH